MTERRRGRVEIGVQVLYNHKQALALSRDLVIWRIDENIMTHTVTWWAESEHFEPVREGTIPPEYTAQELTSDSGEISVAWIKQ